MPALTEAILFVFGLIALGYVAGRLKVLGSRVGEALTEFAVAIALPVLLFRTMIAADFTDVHPWSLWAAYFSAIAMSWLLGQFIVTRGFGRDRRAGVVAGVSASFSNLVLIGVPLVLGLHGERGFEILSILIMVHLPVMMAASIALFAWVERAAGTQVPLQRVAARFLHTFITNPLIIGILAGLAWRFSGLAMPGPMARIVDALAGLAGPVALFALGLGLVRFGISGPVVPAIALGAIKLILMPAMVLGLVLLLGLPPLTATIAVTAAALPTGINPYLIATRFDTGQRLASNAMTMTTAAAVLTTGFWLLVVAHVFG